MKLRTVSAIVLAAGLTVGATGCSLIAPVATSTPYAPSDGVNVSIGGADIRNIMLIEDESGENFNVVFSSVNTGADDLPLTINFERSGSGFASADFTIEPGSTLFGNPEGDTPPTLVSLGDVSPGETVTAFFQVPGADEVEYDIPVLDGTLEEYRDYVLSDQSAEAAQTEDAEDGPSSGTVTENGAGADASADADATAE